MLPLFGRCESAKRVIPTFYPMVFNTTRAKRGRCGNTLIGIHFQGRHRSKRVRLRMSTSKSRPGGLGVLIELRATWPAWGAFSLATGETGLTSPGTVEHKD